MAAFIAPVVLGGEAAPTPAAGRGIGEIAEALRLEAPRVRRLGEDVLIEGRVAAARGGGRRAPARRAHSAAGFAGSQ